MVASAYLIKTVVNIAHVSFHFKLLSRSDDSYFRSFSLCLMVNCRPYLCEVRYRHMAGSLNPQ